jgi:hypothetical protein
MRWLTTLGPTATLCSVILLLSYSFVSTLAHTFSPNESATFISLVDQIKSALVPILQYDSSNLTAINEQAQHARMLLSDDVLKELKERNERIGTDLPRMLDSLTNTSSQDLDGNITELNDLLEEALTVRVERDQLTNATVQALALAEDVNKILDEYSIAFNKSIVPMSMSMNMSMNEANTTDMGKMNNEAVKDINAYQRAHALTNLALERFDTELKAKSNFTSAMDQVSKGLEQLGMAIENKVSPTKVMEIVHGQIQTNLQTAYNLELAPPAKHEPTENVSSSIDNMNNSMSNHMMMNMS